MSMFNTDRTYPTDRHGIRQLDVDNRRPRYRMPKTWVSQNNWRGRKLFLSLFAHVESNIATWIEFDLMKVKTSTTILPHHPVYVNAGSVKPGMRVAAFVDNDGKRFIWSPETFNFVINNRDVPEPEFIKFIYKLCVDTQDKYPVSEQVKHILATKTIDDLKK